MTSAPRALSLPNGGEVFWAGKAALPLGVGLYRPGSLIGKAYKAVGGAIGGTRCSGALNEAIQAAAIPNADLRAGYFSPAGHWQKLLLVLAHESGLVLVKCPIGRGAERRIQNEKEILNYVLASPAVGPHVPGLADYPFGSDLVQRGIAMEFIETEPSFRTTSQELSDLMQAMATLARHEVRVDRCATMQEASEFIDRTPGLLPEWHAALDGLRNALAHHGARTITTCLAHRDLAPWNLVRGRFDRRLRVIDWEYGAPGREEHHDRIGSFLFNAIGRGESPEQTAARFVRAVCESGCAEAALLLHLLDTSVQYLRFFFEGRDRNEGKVLRTLACAAREVVR